MESEDGIAIPNDDFFTNDDAGDSPCFDPPSTDEGKSEFASIPIGVWRSGYYKIGISKIRLVAMSGHGVLSKYDAEEKWTESREIAIAGIKYAVDNNLTLEARNYNFRRSEYGRVILAYFNDTTNKYGWITISAHDWFHRSFGNYSKKIHADRDGHTRAWKTGTDGRLIKINYKARFRPSYVFCRWQF